LHLFVMYAGDCRFGQLKLHPRRDVTWVRTPCRQPEHLPLARRSRMEAIGDTRIAQQMCGDLQLLSMSWDAPEFNIHHEGERRR